MDGFAERGIDEGDFGEKKGLSVVKAFDAFREYTFYTMLSATSRNIIRTSRTRYGLPST